MKLALVTETYPPEVNGVAMTLQRLVHGLAARGHAVEVARPHQPRIDARDAASMDNPRHLLLPGVPLPFYKELKLGLPSGRKLRRRWTEWRPDVVHVATEGPLGWSALFAARRLKLPVSSTFHTNFHQYTQRYLFNATRGLALGYLRCFHNRCGCTLVPTDQARGELVAERFERVGVLSRGVDGKLFDPARRSTELRRTWGARDETPVFAYVGRIAVEKNIELAVEAFLAAKKVLPDARFVLVGDGPARKDLAARHPDFHFAGMRRGEELGAHYASADAFLFPSTTETFGNVVTEGMASGLVVLTFDYAAGRQHIASGRNGVLAPFGDRAAFVRAAEEIAARRAEWPALRAAARRTAEGVTWDAIFASYEDSLRQVIAGRFGEKR